MELYDVMRTTHAVRDFTDDPLPDDVLARILDNARFAPSGGNRQGAHVVVVRSEETRERLVELTATGARRYLAQQRAGESPWNTVHPTALTAEQIAETRVPRGMTEPLRTAPVVLVFLVDLAVVASLDSELDRVGVVSGGSIYPLVWNTLLAARNEGFGGVITTMAVAEEPALLDLLGAPEGYAVAAVVPMGRPVKQLTRLRRQAVEEFVTLESFDGTPLGDD
ncbi:nitroreductase [Nocardioides luteus]|uniref:Nitroreductase n=1 Tax=Nocardioides luteus TaxID=1844 RepID=A0ABQ5SSG4_9ACTN|nr:nitroreductase family protein [Nocardioides luteus]MDR7310998.1 nitroreductase [Nocardioides luteus]GGR67469.1 nitroreductase [Nocardioides luteus]GLJ66543.1 nitroreductase [Nocardioides luteus]